MNRRWIGRNALSLCVVVVMSILFLAAAVRAERQESPRFVRLTEGAAVTDEASSGSGQWVDVDGDGDLDLFVANGYDVSRRPVGQHDRLYLNAGNGNLVSIQDVPVTSDGAPSSSGVWGDYDNDGDVDLFVPVQLNQNNLLYRNEGGARLEPVRGIPPVSDGGLSFAAAWVDADNDGWLDLFVSNGGLSGVGLNFLYRGSRSGRFEHARPSVLTTDSAVNVGASWADYDGDGDMDVYIAHQMSRLGLSGALFRNDGDWRVTRIIEGPVVNDTASSLAGAWGDYDNDGDLDLAVATRGGFSNRLYRNDGGAFTRVLDAGPAVLDGSNAFGVLWADADNDADLDLLSINWGSPSFLYTNLGDGRFERREHGDLGTLETTGAAGSWGDYDRDGDLDLYLANWPDYPTTRQRNHLYRNESANGNHWLEVKVVGTESNRSGVGARITARIRIDGRVVSQLREVTTHTGFRSQNPLEQHFGLGTATIVDELTVRWPSGAVQQFTALPADRRIVITEGSATIGEF